ncbi:MAG: 2Fe-2S iron-sulfur cluster-binding protein, partial [Phycisphaeraceae bacterium]
MNEQLRTIEFELNGRPTTMSAPVRETLADALRHRCHEKGVHLGCEHGVCGACTVEIDGRTVRSCLLLAPQAEGHSVVTVGGISGPDDELSPLQAEFSRQH